MEQPNLHNLPSGGCLRRLLAGLYDWLLVIALMAVFPFSKLLHMPGVFLSPTRNMANSNRAVRHVNPWDHPVKVHPYDEYEDEWRDKMKASGVPVDKE